MRNYYKGSDTNVEIVERSKSKSVQDSHNRVESKIVRKSEVRISLVS